MTTYFRLLFILFFISPFFAFGQTNSDYNANTFLIQFDADASPQEISDLRTKLQSVELGITPVNGIRLWQVGSFPIEFNDVDGQVYSLNNIVEVQGFSNGKPKVNGTDLDYRLEDTEAWNLFDFDYSMYYYTPTPSCSNYSLICQANIGEVKVGYIDTGLSTNGHEVMFEDYYSEDYNAIEPGNDPTDNHGHGTQMAGMAAATMADQGVGSAVQLVPLKAMDNTGFANLFHIIYAVEMARVMGVNILNLSFGYQPIEGDASELLEIALRGATEAGMLVIASAGNSGMNIRSDKFYPACFSNRMDRMITVGAVKCNGRKTGFTNWNKNTVQIAAPGQDILAPIPGGQWVKTDGTSHSASITTTIAALIGTHLYNFNADIVKSIILQSAYPNPYLYNKVSTSGHVDAQYALSLLYYYYGLSEEEGDDIQAVVERIAPPTTLPRTTVPELEAVELPTISSTQTDDKALSLFAFPNPFVETVHLKVQGVQQEVILIEVFNTTGQLVKSFEKTLSTTNVQVLELDLSILEAAGLYHVKLSADETVLNTKIYKK